MKSPTPNLSSLLETAHRVVKAQYDFEPLFAEVFFSDRHLFFWEAAAIWISHDSPPKIQLRTKLKKGSFLGVSAAEILAHEAVHEKRKHLSSLQFEEILAYQTSLSKVRRFWGPLFRTPKEALLFFIISLSSLLSLLGLPFLIFLPLVYLAFLILRLSHDQATFKKACKKASLATIVTYSDQEIRSLAERL